MDVDNLQSRVWWFTLLLVLTSTINKLVLDSGFYQSYHPYKLMSLVKTTGVQLVKTNNPLTKNVIFTANFDRDGYQNFNVQFDFSNIRNSNLRDSWLSFFRCSLYKQTPAMIVIFLTKSHLHHISPSLRRHVSKPHIFLVLAKLQKQRFFCFFIHRCLQINLIPSHPSNFSRCHAHLSDPKSSIKHFSVSWSQYNISLPQKYNKLMNLESGWELNPIWNMFNSCIRSRM